MRALQSYQDNQIEGLSENRPIALIGALLDKAILCIQTASIACQNHQPQMKGQEISKAIKILNDGLLPSLNPDAAPEMSTQFSQVYQYCIDKLIQANIHNNHTLMSECAQHLLVLRDGWKSVEKQFPHG